MDAPVESSLMMKRRFTAPRAPDAVFGGQICVFSGPGSSKARCFRRIPRNHAKRKTRDAFGVDYMARSASLLQRFPSIMTGAAHDGDNSGGTEAIDDLGTILTQGVVQ